MTYIIRISDDRMTGTGFDNIVLQAAPEAGEGGTLALVMMVINPIR